MLKYQIEELKLEDLKEALKVVEVTFMKFEAPDYSEEKNVGVIGYRDNSHINLLFVLEEYQYNGIAKALYNLVIENCKKIGTKRVTVNSSPYAHNVYLKFGFIDDDKMQEIDGIKFYPMHKEI